MIIYNLLDIINVALSKAQFSPTLSFGSLGRLQDPPAFFLQIQLVLQRCQLHRIPSHLDLFHSLQ